MARSLSLIILLVLGLLLPLAHSKPIRFRFYLQDKFTSPNRTVYQVATSEITSTSPTAFGLLSVVYDPLTAGPERDSALVGYAQGTIAFADMEVMAAHASITFLFTAGEYNGSSFNMVGRNAVAEEVRRVPVAGGTGAFLMAQGIVETKTHSSDPEMNWATYQYDVTIVPGNNLLDMFE